MDVSDNLRGVAIQLGRQGFVGRPEWHSVVMGTLGISPRRAR